MASDHRRFEGAAERFFDTCGRPIADFWEQWSSPSTEGKEFRVRRFPFFSWDADHSVSAVGVTAAAPLVRIISRPARWLAYGMVVVLFSWFVSFYYIPGKGFTYLIEFGSEYSDQLLPEIKAVNHYEVPNSGGYDGQWYAQIAVHPNLGDLAAKDIPAHVLHYRARRILFEWTAWLLGGGNPIRVLNIYAL